MVFEALTRQEMKHVIEGNGTASRVPVGLHFWCHPQVFGEKEPQIAALMRQYPMDFDVIGFRLPEPVNAPADDPTYRWLNIDSGKIGRQINKSGLDSNVYLPDFDALDELIRNFPSPFYPNLFSSDNPRKKYTVCLWWYCLFERHWSLRGMENALTDYYLYPDEVHKLFRTFTDFYKKIIIRAKKEQKVDAILVSDDIGMQTGPFFSHDIFLEFFKPYYKELIDTAHQNDMHFWLHTCGNVEPFLNDLIEIGLDVIHPIQKYTMDEEAVAKQYGGRICIWAGFDVQQTIPYKTPEDVRKEVRFLMNTYYRPQGRFMITAGNGITADCPFESLKALFEECYSYGSEVGRISGKTAK